MGWYRSMCLHLQSQDFERHVEGLVATLWGSSAYATDALTNISSFLGKEAAQLEAVHEGLDQLQVQGDHIAEGVGTSLAHLAQVRASPDPPSPWVLPWDTKESGSVGTRSKLVFFPPFLPARFAHD